MVTRKTVIGIAVLALAMAPTAWANSTFTLNDSAALLLWDAWENPDSTSSLLFSTTDPVKYNAATMSGTVGFVGTLDNTGSAYSPFASIGIGANFWGTSSTGSGATTAHVIGTALGTADTNDLSGFDTYSLYLQNDNDDNWLVNIFMNTGYTGWGETDQFYENGWTELGPGQGVVLSIDLSGVANLNHVTNIGFMVGGNMTGVNPNPSNFDAFHVSIAAVPAPGASALVVLGLALVGGIKRRMQA